MTFGKIRRGISPYFFINTLREQRLTGSQAREANTAFRNAGVRWRVSWLLPSLTLFMQNLRLRGAPLRSLPPPNPPPLPLSALPPAGPPVRPQSGGAGRWRSSSRLPAAPSCRSEFVPYSSTMLFLSSHTSLANTFLGTHPPSPSRSRLSGSSSARRSLTDARTTGHEGGYSGKDGPSLRR